ncbi:MAG TPA: hypothetical protein H9667_11245 [Firmicutes bacterium]|nr:hypothetical protein [Bacillota bacterium]
MKKYQKSGYDVYHYDFETLHQFLNQIQSAPVNRNVFPRSASHKDDTEWCGTRNFEEAVDLCQKGWSKDFEKLIRLKKRIDEKLLSPIPRSRQIADVVGYTPSVPEYLIGNPLNMWNQTQKQIPTFINVYLNLAYNCGTGRDEIFNRGIIVQSVVDALQDRGYSVRFKTFICVEEDDEVIFSTFNLKGEGEKLNIRKTYFPLCHPSFFRRLVFLLMETTPVVYRSWDNGYGHPSNSSTIKKIINPGPNDIVITQPSEIGIRGYDIDDDLESFLRHTNLQELLTRI